MIPSELRTHYSDASFAIEKLVEGRRLQTGFPSYMNFSFMKEKKREQDLYHTLSFVECTLITLLSDATASHVDSVNKGSKDYSSDW